jgi:hypothetical protein
MRILLQTHMLPMLSWTVHPRILTLDNHRHGLWTLAVQFPVPLTKKRIRPFSTLLE